MVLSVVALTAVETPALGEDDFPLVGTYTENQVCARQTVRTPGLRASRSPSRHQLGVRPLHDS